MSTRMVIGKAESVQKGLSGNEIASEEKERKREARLIDK